MTIVQCDRLFFSIRRLLLHWRCFYRSTNIFQKPREHLKILDVIMVAGNKFHAEDLKIFGRNLCTPDGRRLLWMQLQYEWSSLQLPKDFSHHLTFSKHRIDVIICCEKSPCFCCCSCVIRRALWAGTGGAKKRISVFCSGNKCVSSPNCPESFWGTPSLLFKGYSWVLSRGKSDGVMEMSRPSFSAEVRNAWSYISTSL
jgi:hypothetical protein